MTVMDGAFCVGQTDVRRVQPTR